MYACCTEVHPQEPQEPQRPQLSGRCRGPGGLQLLFVRATGRSTRGRPLCLPACLGSVPAVTMAVGRQPPITALSSRGLGGYGGNGGSPDDGPPGARAVLRRGLNKRMICESNCVADVVYFIARASLWRGTRNAVLRRAGRSRVPCLAWIYAWSVVLSSVQA